jgi:hypothetical protein
MSKTPEHTNIKKVIGKYCSMFSDKQHRFHSWRHCFTYFNSGKPLNTKIAALHLAFYLASWGMYRGSSFLLWKDYTVHIGAVNILEMYTYLAKVDFLTLSYESKSFKDIFKLKQELIDYYSAVKKSSYSKSKRDAITDTLVTKVILGTLACVPAYDRYLKLGIRHLQIGSDSFTEKNFVQIIEFYKRNHETFTVAKNKLNLKNTTPMRLVDMYLWQVGYNLCPDKEE